MVKNQLIKQVREIRKILDSIQDKLKYSSNNYFITLRITRLKKLIVEMEEELKFIESLEVNNNV